jgi:hypothetical protein
MTKFPIITKLILSLALCWATSTQAVDCPALWKSTASHSHCESLNFQTHVSYPVTSVFGNSPRHALINASIRAGFLKENPATTFKGNILYFEGLADSMLNHLPLFTALTNEGFRVIAFDYMGQGGSNGSMNNTRLIDIPRLGQMVYQKFARNLSLFLKTNHYWLVYRRTGGLSSGRKA